MRLDRVVVTRVAWCHYTTRSADDDDDDDDDGGLCVEYRIMDTVLLFFCCLLAARGNEICSSESKRNKQLILKRERKRDSFVRLPSAVTLMMYTAQTSAMHRWRVNSGKCRTAQYRDPSHVS